MKCENICLNTHNEDKHYVLKIQRLQVKLMRILMNLINLCLASNNSILLNLQCQPRPTIFDNDIFVNAKSFSFFFYSSGECRRELRNHKLNYSLLPTDEATYLKTNIYTPKMLQIKLQVRNLIMKLSFKIQFQNSTSPLSPPFSPIRIV